MKSFRQMNDDEFRQHIESVAHMFAVRKYHATHPDATRADAWTFATQTWKEFIDTAIDFVAMTEADREARAQAPLN